MMDVLEWIIAVVVVLASLAVAFYVKVFGIDGVTRTSVRDRDRYTRRTYPRPRGPRHR